jgi:hypothetical protein
MCHRAADGHGQLPHHLPRPRLQYPPLHGSLGQAIMAYALCLACGFAFGWMFVWMGLVAGNAQSAQGMSMIIYPFMFVSSAYVRVDTRAL